jgi:hypothetical protein
VSSDLVGFFFIKNLFIANAVSPLPEVAPAATSAMLLMHAGHIGGYFVPFFGD